MYLNNFGNCVQGYYMWERNKKGLVCVTVTINNNVNKYVFEYLRMWNNSIFKNIFQNWN